MLRAVEDPKPAVPYAEAAQPALDGIQQTLRRLDPDDPDHALLTSVWRHLDLVVQTHDLRRTTR